MKTEGAVKEKIKGEREEFWKRKFRGCAAAKRILKQARQRMQNIHWRYAAILKNFNYQFSIFRFNEH